MVNLNVLTVSRRPHRAASVSATEFFTKGVHRAAVLIPTKHPGQQQELQPDTFICGRGERSLQTVKEKIK